MGLNLLNDGTIKDAVGNALAGTFPDVGPAYTVSTVHNASLSGFVYDDTNGNGSKDSTDPPLPGVIITLTGVDSLTQAIPTQTAKTDSNGAYQFTGLAPGTYKLTEAQPSKLLVGTSTAGSLGGNASANVISGIVETSNSAGTGYDFNQHGLIQTELLKVLVSRSFLASAASPQTFWNSEVNLGPTAPVVTSIVARRRQSYGRRRYGALHGDFQYERYERERRGFRRGAEFLDLRPSVAGVSGSGSTYTVTVNTGTLSTTGGGSGTLGLNLADDDSIINSSGTPLAGTGTGNGNYTGPLYTVTTASAAAQTVSAAAATANQMIDQAFSSTDSWT